MTLQPLRHQNHGDHHDADTYIAELDQRKNIAFGDRTDKWTISISGANIHLNDGSLLGEHFRAATFNLD